MRWARLRWVVGLGAAAILAGLLAPWIVRTYWGQRSANPVRRGVERARELGCFACHGELGGGGIPDPTATPGEVPAWSGGTWMMYVDNDAQIREYILDGISETRRASPGASAERSKQTIVMPAYRSVLSGTDLDDLVTAFRVLSRMSVPASGTPERRGLDVAERWRCFACHGPAASGGLPNPGSLTGFVPGWYGPDFADLVRDRGEFDTWVREGTIARLASGRIAPYFLARQRIAMPAYRSIDPADLDALWEYTRWLARTDGGHRGTARPW